MGKTITADCQEIEVERGTTVADIKDEVGAVEDDVATYKERDEIGALGDNDKIHDAVPDDAELSFKQGKGTVFG